MELLIENGGKLYAPAVEAGVVWETQRKGAPGKLTFTMVGDGAVSFREGNHVRLRAGGQDVFYGFLFTQKRDKSGLIDATAYDQLRYLKNKDTLVYEGKKASELIQMLAADFNLQCGEIEDTGYVIESGVEENAALFDMIQNAWDETLGATGNLFVLYDDFGKIALRSIESMKLDLLLDEEAGEDFEYSSSIDAQTYNKVKLAYNDEEAGKRRIFVKQDEPNIDQWGVLQYFEQMQNETGAEEKAAALLKLYNHAVRKLTIKNALGDLRVRAGTSVAVALNLGDRKVQNYMVVEKAKHTFQDDWEHRMELTLIGGDFLA